MNQLLEVEYVHFPSRPDTYRVRLDTTDGTLPFKLWVENKHSKAEWAGVFNDQHKLESKGADRMLPGPQVISMLKGALLASCTKTNKTDGGDDVTVDLMEESNGHVCVTMKVKKPSARFSFSLAPVDAEATTKLEDHVHALEEEVAELKKTTEQLKTYKK